MNKRYLVMFVDITEQRATEARLRAAQEKAEAANRAKSEFLANMSHEIRTPMNAILGMQSLCLDGALNEGKRDYLLTAQNAAKTLLGLLNDLLDLSKIEAGQLRLDAHPFALSQVLDPLHTMMMPLAEEKGLEVVIDCPPEVPETLYGDALRLSQILLNLANNAVKFTEQGVIHIEARLLERLPAEPDAARERVHLEFRVRDTGIGLSEEQSALLFQPFHQADGSITRRYGGTGLGLSICKRLALMMDGAIGVNSQLGEGSTFWFTLWLQCPLPGERPARGTSLCLAQAPPELAGRRVLLVEDNAFNREVARILLERAGLSVSEAEQGVAALAQLREQGCAAFDLVLMDIQMPEMDGLEATQRIRALPDGRRLPIIGLTAHVRDEDVTRALEAGMNAHLGKPFEPARLYGILAEQLGLAVQGGPGAQSESQTGPQAEPQSEHERLAETLDLPAIGGLDPAALRIMLGPDVDSWRKFLRLFADNHGGRLARIDAALAAADHALAEHEAHSLVGAAGMLGLTEIRAAAGALEDRLRDHPQVRGKIAQAHRQLAELLQPALAAIAAWRDSNGSNTTDPPAAMPIAAVPVNRTRLNEVLAELQDLADAHDPVAEERWHQENALLQAGLEPEAYRRLERQITGYRFPQASATLAQARKGLVLSDWLEPG